MKIVIAALLLLAGIANAEYIDIHGSPNFVGENYVVELSFNLSSATLCRGNIDVDASYPNMAIEFTQLNQTFNASISQTFALGTHEVFIKCGNENLYSDSFHYTFTVVPADQTPEKIEERQPVSPPLPPQQTPSNNNPGSQPSGSPPVAQFAINSTIITNNSNNSKVSLPQLPKNISNELTTNVPSQVTGLATSATNNWEPIVGIIVLLAIGFGYFKFKR